jgi:hypothetical protein
MRAMKRDGVISVAEHDLARASDLHFASSALRADR